MILETPAECGIKMKDWLNLLHRHEVYKGVDLMVYGTLIRNQDASFSLLISFLGVIENSYLFGCGKLYL